MYFTFDSGSSILKTDETKELINTALQVGFVYWDSMVSNAGTSLYDLGFIAY